MAVRTTDPKKPSYSWSEILSLRAFRPSLKDMRYPLEERLSPFKEIVVIGQDGSATTIKILTRGRKGWSSRAANHGEDLGDRPVVGVLGFEDVPYVGNAGKKDERTLADLLAANPKTAGVEQVSDNNSQIQTVWLGTDRHHLIWRVPPARVKQLERLSGSAPIVRVTHGLASLLRLALESFDPAKHPDVILCGDHSNFAWLDVISGRIQEMVKPHNCPTRAEFSEWMASNLSQMQLERAVNIELWTSEFCWLQELPNFHDESVSSNVSFTHRMVPASDLIFA